MMGRILALQKEKRIGEVHVEPEQAFICIADGGSRFDRASDDHRRNCKNKRTARVATLKQGYTSKWVAGNLRVPRVGSRFSGFLTHRVETARDALCEGHDGLLDRSTCHYQISILPTIAYYRASSRVLKALIDRRRL
jgi:hypothetical protein